MHLINATTHELKAFVGDEIPKYAILSHVWGDEEVLFQDMRDLDAASKRHGFAKIRATCEAALKDRLHYAWIDTCCINKESSAELSEAINSMFRWYSCAAKCYAYLVDVEVGKGDGMEALIPTTIYDSRWFTRGWTLQELIAPADVTFVDRHWRIIGTKKRQLLHTVNRITGVDKEVLMNSSTLARLSIAKRISWAAKRKTTRVEDEAYSLLGLLGVNMPLLYGEGRDAFQRLQEELIRKTTDQSLFVHSGGRLLADGPGEFEGCADVMLCDGALMDEPYEMTNAGLRIMLPTSRSADSARQFILAVLNCRRRGNRLLLPLFRPLDSPNPGIVQRSIMGTTKDTDTLELLLSSHVEQLIIVKNQLIPDAQPLELEMNRLWVHIVNSKDGVQLAVKTLTPRSGWDVAVPIRGRVNTRVGHAGRLISCSWQGGSDSSVSRTITLDMTVTGAEAIPIVAYFSISKMSEGGALLGELRMRRPDQNSVDDRLDVEPELKLGTIWTSSHLLTGTTLQLVLHVQGWSITAAMEVFERYAAVGQEFLLQFQVDQTAAGGASNPNGNPADSGGILVEEDDLTEHAPFLDSTGDGMVSELDLDREEDDREEDLPLSSSDGENGRMRRRGDEAVDVNRPKGNVASIHKRLEGKIQTFVSKLYKG